MRNQALAVRVGDVREHFLFRGLGNSHVVRKLLPRGAGVAGGNVAWPELDGITQGSGRFVMPLKIRR